jgi:cyclic lactone autoinducer peptide
MKKIIAKYATLALSAVAVATVSGTASLVFVHNPKVPQDLLK